MTDRTHVLDASAVLALLHNEPGGASVAPLLATSCVSSVNWAEILQKASQRGLDIAATADRLARLGLVVLPFSREEAELAAALWGATQQSGLSLGDRACLAVAKRLRLPAVTADRDWMTAAADVTIQVIR